MRFDVGCNRRVLVQFVKKRNIHHVKIKVEEIQINLTLLEFISLPVINVENHLQNFSIKNGRRNLNINTKLEKVDLVLNEFKPDSWTTKTKVELKLVEYHNLVNLCNVVNFDQI